jgi:D-serine deaminase-like pyridoxal phosphate-dependent protein
MSTASQLQTASNPATDLNVEDYRIRGAEKVLTPALAVYPEFVDVNISGTLRVLDNQPDRWRPHIKSAKLPFTISRFATHGITQVKCSTTLELAIACQSGITDVLIAYPCAAAGARRVSEIQRANPTVTISALVETPGQLDVWRGTNVGLFIDVNPGMNRTGIEPARTEEVLSLAQAIRAQGNAFRGLHYYDGHLRQSDLDEREKAAFRGYEQLVSLTDTLAGKGLSVQEVITSGTPTSICAISFPGFRTNKFKHRISAGTVVYNDTTSLAQLPAKWGLRPAAIVVATVVSHPTNDIVTCDAGHKTLSVDAGVPNCVVLGYPGLEALHPREEHLPFRVKAGTKRPAIGETLYLLPKHVCPTVNNFDHALLVRNGEIESVASVAARGREHPLGGTTQQN